MDAQSVPYLLPLVIFSLGECGAPEDNCIANVRFVTSLSELMGNYKDELER